ncbi:uncharacterized protein [Antedon mediterranea]|uniref:uncharacterized protein n=1 Tax=Antedon mediterranea TaxID=105859 RepID=UPI003AF8373D
MVSSCTNPAEDTFTSTTLTDGSSTTFMSTDVTMGDTFATSVRSVSPVDTTFTNVTPMQSEISSMFSTLPNTPVHSSRKVKTVFNKNHCLSYVGNKHLLDQKYQSPTLVQLKLKKQKSVAKLVKAFEHLDCKKTITIDFDDIVQPMIAQYGKEIKEIDENKLASADVNEDINDINIKNQLQNLAFEKHTTRDIKPVAKFKTTSIKETVSSSSIELGSKKIELNTTQIDDSKSNTAKQEKEFNRRGKKVRTIPEKLFKLWSASILHEYTSDDFNVGQGVEVIVMNEDDPKWLYVQIAMDINGPANLQEKTAGFVPRSLVIPRFALPATRNSYRSLDSRKKKYFCNHIRMSSNPETPDSNDLKNQKYRKSESLVDLTDSTPKTQIIAKDRKEVTTLNTADTNSSEKSKHEHFEKDSPKELFQSFSTDALIIESYTVITNYKPTEVDEVEVLTGEVVVVHAGQQREIDWMWVYVPRAERFGYIPAFCARPFALELPM